MPTATRSATPAGSPDASAERCSEGRYRPDITIGGRTTSQRCSCGAPYRRHRLPATVTAMAVTTPMHGASNSRSARWWRPTSQPCWRSTRRTCPRSARSIGPAGVHRRRVADARSSSTSTAGRRVLPRPRCRLDVRLGELSVVHGSLLGLHVPRPRRLRRRRSGQGSAPPSTARCTSACRRSTGCTVGRSRSTSIRRTPSLAFHAAWASSRSASRTRPTASPCR